jgi:hypothetical protein
MLMDISVVSFLGNILLVFYLEIFKQCYYEYSCTCVYRQHAWISLGYILGNEIAGQVFLKNAKLFSKW